MLEVDPNRCVAQLPKEARVEESTYESYQLGLKLMRSGSPAAASQVLGRLVEAQPNSRSAREALGRAQYRSGRYAQAQSTFSWIAARDPADDYAHFGAGLAATRVGDVDSATGHLAMAVALRPGRDAYRRALESARGLLGEAAS